MHVHTHYLSTLNVVVGNVFIPDAYLPQTPTPSIKGINNINSTHKPK